MSARTLQPGVEPGVVAAAALTTVEAAVAMAIAAGELAHKADCTGIAHAFVADHRNPKDDTFKLEANALDFVLHQHPTNVRDLALLCIVAAERFEGLETFLDEAADQQGDAIASALSNIAGFAVSMLSPADIRAIPARMRDTAENALANVTSFDSAKAAFA